MNNIGKKIDLSGIISDIIYKNIEDIVNDETTTAVFFGFYAAHCKLYKSAMTQYADAEEAVDNLQSVIPAYKWDGTEYADSVPMYLLRDFAEDYVRERIMPDENDEAYSLIENIIDEYDWCDLAGNLSEMFDSFIKESD